MSSRYEKPSRSCDLGHLHITLYPPPPQATPDAICSAWPGGPTKSDVDRKWLHTYGYCLLCLFSDTVLFSTHTSKWLVKSFQRCLKIMVPAEGPGAKADHWVKFFSQDIGFDFMV